MLSFDHNWKNCRSVQKTLTHFDNVKSKLSVEDCRVVVVRFREHTESHRLLLIWQSAYGVNHSIETTVIAVKCVLRCILISARLSIPRTMIWYAITLVDSASMVRLWPGSARTSLVKHRRTSLTNSNFNSLWTAVYLRVVFWDPKISQPLRTSW